MPKLLIIGRRSASLTDLGAALRRRGFETVFFDPLSDLMEQVRKEAPEVIAIEMGDEPESGSWEMIGSLKAATPSPVVVLVPPEHIEGLEYHPNADDFMVEPYDAREFAIRSRRLLRNAVPEGGEEQIKCDGLMIDLARCEVTVDGFAVALTFKEYELLKLLAQNSGRVFTREALLNKVWGYDYYGGERTVDVHIRRLRSKLESPHRQYIDTVRNIGYRFSAGHPEHVTQP